MNKKLVIAIAAIVMILDQVSKYIIGLFIKSKSLVLIKKVLYLTYVKNYGVAFNMLDNKRFVIILFSVILLALIYNYMKNFKNNKRNIIAFGLVYGGIVGNFVDRLFLGYVRDFIDFRIINYPVFNIADSAIVIGIVLLIIAIFKKEDLENGVQSSNK